MDDEHISDFDRRLGRRLREARIMRGCTQKDIGAFAGVSFQQIQKNEKGLNQISAERLYRISQRLKLPITYFFEETSLGDGQSAIRIEEITKLVAAVEKLPDGRITTRIRHLVTAINRTWEQQSEG
ncbi:helix-turn-helix domain-containing protein [Rhodobium gokarnense]|uniref:Transcriptional regulator with XRE-family HTH domain n=1 Tax=Rhodobium gokarnense TaxID=364296 RepID=A0ABT3HEM8_9HYPH|nr:helix-turn-helix transcriptional regulator [Rhodobium gokarnense]MCW2308847.1 transcriptional regulator with XRE-family HTH domain [Rhodobium gokarnense]